MIQHRKIKKLGLGEYVDYLVTSEEAGTEKPGRRIFERVMEKMGHGSEELLMVGDSERRDIEGAMDMGIPGILFTKDRADDMDKTVLEYVDEKQGKRHI